MSTQSFIKWLMLALILLAYGVAALRQIDTWNWLLGVTGFAALGASALLIVALIRYSAERWGPAIEETIQYLYFMRFSLLLWAFLILLPVLDLSGITTSITRGMFALEVKRGLVNAQPSSSTGWNPGQFIWVSFYVFLCGWIALLSARIVCAYGKERFITEPPWFFRVAREDRGTETNLSVDGGVSWLAFLGSQVPGLIFLAYTAWVSVSESSSRPEDHLHLWMAPLGFVIGFLFAGLAWFLAAYFYHLLSRSTVGEFHYFFLPRLPKFFRTYLQDVLGSEPPRTKLIEGIDWLLTKLFTLGPGLTQPSTSKLNPGIALAVILFFLLLLIYTLVGYVTKPVRWYALWTASQMIFILWTVLVAVPLVLFGVLLLSPLLAPARDGDNFGRRISRVISALGEPQGWIWIVWAVAIIPGVVNFFGVLWRSFPVLATILILALSLCWAGSGFAFLLDRWRIPVVTTALLALLLIWWGLSLDHFYTTFQAPNTNVVPASTVEVIDKFKGRHGSDPMIVVTASGGGIHSAAWTATVLNGVEEAFKAQDKQFHQHVVLMSSVSGGSVAASYWAESYLDEANRGIKFDTSVTKTIVDHTECSSLEAAAWGVLFPDFNHLLVWKDLAAIPFSGLRVWDRGWALETAFERNRFDGCDWPDRQVPHPELYKLTDLRDKLKELKDVKTATDVPAFAFNAVEVNNGGQRFLISNYRVPPFLPVSPTVCDTGLRAGNFGCPPLPQRARDFLEECPNLDLSLFTAARLSANFPYVSPVAVAKLPKEFTGAQKTANDFCAKQHLADGGYYDDDGMDSAMEFLWSAFGPETDLARLKAEAAGQPEAPRAPVSRGEEQVPNSGRCPHQSAGRPCVIVIEIRNSEEPPADPSTPKPPILGHIVEQVAAPPSTLFGAWDVAQPLRNQQEFRFLQFALRDKVDFNHLVFSFIRVPPDRACHLGDEDPDKVKDPLSWHLTPRAKEKIKCEWENIYKPAAEKFAAAFPSAR